MKEGKSYEIISKSLKVKVLKWQSANVELPNFDIETVHTATKTNPTWVHFGAGNIFRVLLLNYNIICLLPVKLIQEL